MCYKHFVPTCWWWSGQFIAFTVCSLKDTVSIRCRVKSQKSHEYTAFTTEINTESKLDSPLLRPRNISSVAPQMMWVLKTSKQPESENMVSCGICVLMAQYKIFQREREKEKKHYNLLTFWRSQPSCDGYAATILGVNEIIKYLVILLLFGGGGIFLGCCEFWQHAWVRFVFAKLRDICSVTCSVQKK